MKIYPKHDVTNEEDKGFTAEEIRRGIHMLYADVTCQDCGKVHSVAQVGSSDKGECLKCGGPTR